MNGAVEDAPLIFLVAGEASGDVIGARLMLALQAQTEGKARFAGIGGEHMQRAGLKSLFPMHELSVMGIFEILPHIPKLLRRIRQTEREARRLSADIVVTIDSPDFCFRVGKRLKGSGIPVVHYVAPQVWAWRPGRARKIAKFLAHLLLLFPFEEKYFDGTGLQTTFVGHPLGEGFVGDADGAAFRRDHSIPEGKTLGWAVIPAVPALREKIAAAVKSWNIKVVVVDGSEREAKYAALAASNAALTSSGTATLELAIAGVPMVVAYRANPFTVAVARKVVNVQHIALANIVAGRRAAPEVLQEACTPNRLAPAVENILLDPAVRDDQIECFRTVSRQLGIGGTAPSELAAKAVLAVFQTKLTNMER